MNEIGNPAAGAVRKLVAYSRLAPTYQWYNKAVFWLPRRDLWRMARDAARGPNFFTTDASLVKNTPLHENVSLQLRVNSSSISSIT